MSHAVVEGNKWTLMLENTVGQSRQQFDIQGAATVLHSNMSNPSSFTITALPVVSFLLILSNFWVKERSLCEFQLCPHQSYKLILFFQRSHITDDDQGHKWFKTSSSLLCLHNILNISSWSCLDLGPFSGQRFRKPNPLFRKLSNLKEMKWKINYSRVCTIILPGFS